MTEPAHSAGNGQLFWITGLAGAGKTTIGRALHGLIRGIKPDVVFLDGDALREVFGNTSGYSQQDRLHLALQYARLCQTLTSQGLDVICATISMFREVRGWNRQHIPKYREVYVRVPIEVLVQRDQKHLYSRALRGEVADVMGVDLPIEEPDTPDLVLENAGERSAAVLAKEVFDRYYAGASRHE